MRLIGGEQRQEVETQDTDLENKTGNTKTISVSTEAVQLQDELQQLSYLSGM